MLRIRMFGVMATRMQVLPRIFGRFRPCLTSFQPRPHSGAAVCPRLMPSVSNLSTTCTAYSGDSALKQTESNSEEDNFQCRVNLAAAYQIIDYLGFGEGIDNHLTLRAPSAQSSKDAMLVVPYGLHWSQVTASRLIAVDFETGETMEGEGYVDPTAFCIHRAMHRARAGSGANCVMHTHQPYATTLSCLKDPRLLMLHQNSTRFHGKIDYYQDFGGVADMDNNMEEGTRMARAFDRGEILFMANHGIIAIGPNVAYVVNALYFLERACQLQVQAMSTGRELFELPEDKVEQTAKEWENYDYAAPLFFNGMKEVMIAKGSKFMT